MFFRRKERAEPEKGFRMDFPHRIPSAGSREMPGGKKRNYELIYQVSFLKKKAGSPLHFSVENVTLS